MFVICIQEVLPHTDGDHMGVCILHSGELTEVSSKSLLSGLCHCDSQGWLPESCFCSVTSAPCQRSLVQGSDLSNLEVKVLIQERDC